MRRRHVSPRLFLFLPHVAKSRKISWASLACGLVDGDLFPGSRILVESAFCHSIAEVRHTTWAILGPFTMPSVEIDCPQIRKITRNSEIIASHRYQICVPFLEFRKSRVITSRKSTDPWKFQEILETFHREIVWKIIGLTPNSWHVVKMSVYSDDIFSFHRVVQFTRERAF
jgi:hypothetical protein